MDFRAVASGDLAQKHCAPCEGGTHPFTPEQIQSHLKLLPGWVLEKDRIVKTFTFKNFYETMAFVNAAAFIAHREDHHPEMEVGYKTCRVCYTTHAIHGLSENDFICAAKIEALLKEI
jgi:4a-hydroxytetrahydrobiopterin dehydratase